MYSFVSSLLREKGTNQSYKSVDLTSVKMSTLYSVYRDGYIELSNPSLTSLTYVTLADLKSADNLIYADLYFPQWLATQGSRTIFGSSIKPTYLKKQIAFSDAIQAGFSMRRVKDTDINGVNSYTTDMMPDIYIRKPLADQSLVKEYVLTTVNGLLHINIPASTGLLIKDGAKSFDIEQDNLIGILSFENIGKLKQIHITKDMVGALSGIESYKQAAYINLKTDLTDKSLMLSFCGRLFVASDVFTIVNNDGLVRINTNKLDLFKIIQQSLGKIDLSTLELDQKLWRGNSLQIKDVIDDDSILAMLSLYQTFFIVVDAPAIFKEEIALMHPRFEGEFETYVNSKLPYIDDNLVMHPYWKIIHQGAYTDINRLHLKSTTYTYPVHETSPYQDPDNYLNDNYDFTDRTQYHTGKLLGVYGEFLSYE